MNQNKPGGWLQVAAYIAILAGLLLVGIQLKQNSDLLKTLALLEKSNRDVDSSKLDYTKRVMDGLETAITDIQLDADRTVAVIGTGDMGDSLGPRLAKLGFQIVYGSRSPDSEKVQALVLATGNGAYAASPAKAAQTGDIVLTLVPWPAMQEVAQNLGDLDGKIVIDVSMPFEQGEDGYPQKMVDTSSAEIIQGFNPGARVVKAWATLGSQVIDNIRSVDGPISVPLASNDRQAKEYVAKIIAAMGMDPVDFGPLRMAREIETLQMIYMIPLVQVRDQSWEFYFRRSNHWYCQEPEGWYDPVTDTGNLATLPRTQGESEPCPEISMGSE